MGRPGVFTGPLVTDVIAWGVGGQLVGSILGYLSAEAYNRIRPGEPQDVVWVGGRAALRAGTFGVLVALTGHLLVAIFY
jgi:hypothetical protein